MCSRWIFVKQHLTWPSGKLPFECQKIAKNLTFFSKKLTKIVIFFHKMSSFCQFFDIQMAIFRKVRCQSGSIWFKTEMETIRMCLIFRTGMSDVGHKWVRWTPKGKNPGIFFQFRHIDLKCTESSLEKFPDLSYKGANLTICVAKSDIPDVWWNVCFGTGRCRSWQAGKSV